jgi:hypothetical protein
MKFFPQYINDGIIILLHCGKIIIWHDFIKAGIVQLKDICYEVKTGFLPNKAIVEMIYNG